MSNRLLPLVTAVLAATLSLSVTLTHATKKPATEAKQAQQEVVEVDRNDPQIKRAIKQARRTLPKFLKIAAEQSPHHDAVAVRVEIREGKHTDFVWITPFSTADGQHFTGSIGSLPVGLDKIEPGQNWTFQRTDIVDWMYIDKQAKAMHGNYITCAQLAKHPQDVAEMKKRYGLDCSRH